MKFSENFSNNNRKNPAWNYIVIAPKIFVLMLC